MINLRKQLTTILKTVCPRVHYQDAHENETLPYIVYDITSVLPNGENNDSVFLDVDIWDSNEKSDNIEGLLKNLRTALEGRTIETEEFSAVIYGANVVPIADPNTMIKRRRASYTINIYA